MKKRKNTSIRTELLLMALLPVLLVAVVTTIYSAIKLDLGLEEEFLEKLHSTATAVHGSYENLNDEDFYVSESGELMKGDYNISAHVDDIDRYTEGLHTQVTIFYGDTRMATTLLDDNGDRMVGTQCDPAVAEAVIERGETYYSTDVTINDVHYFVCYLPLENPDGTIIGMVFCGEPSADVHSFINTSIGSLISIAVVLLIIAAVVATFISMRLAKFIKDAQIVVESISGGNLNTNIPSALLKRRDEIGQMGRSLESLQSKLRDIIGSIQESSKQVLAYGNNLDSIAQQCSATADEISNAITDVAKGATSQAEDVEIATHKVSQMGDLITSIVSSIDNLNETSLGMKRTGEDSSEIMQELSQSNDMTTEAIYQVSNNVSATDRSVQEIASAVEMITNIASQTNLLALNASIEAARAGEAGKGFAVVATEISKLSDESNASAQTISNIIQELAADSRNSLTMMEEVKERLEEQQRKLADTKNRFNTVIRDIDSTTSDTHQINEEAKECDVARNGIIDIIQNLSAVSEENAAATEETTASVEELNATINIVASSAKEMVALAEALDNETKFFTL